MATDYDTKMWNALQELRDALDKKFAQDIIVMDLSNVTAIADYFVIATGGSAPQMQALAETTEEVMVKHEIPLHHTEGIQGGQWMLLDFGGIMVHLFDKESRQFYQLERVWGDAKMV